MSNRLSDSEWNDRVYCLVGDSYIFLESYQGIYHKLPYFHVDCGQVHYISPHNFTSGKRCPYCNRGHRFKLGERKGFHTGTPKKTNAQYVKELKQAHGNDIVLLDKYKDSTTRLHFRCMKCGHKFFNLPNDQLRSNCRFCVARDKVRTRKQNYRMPSPGWSNGEKLIATYLFNKRITYQYSVTFPGLKDINSLTYNFYIPSLDLLIEYQGVQHYNPCTWNKRYSIQEAKVRFAKQQKHDRIKKNFAKENDLQLICISYKVKTLDKLSSILDKYCK